MALREVLASLEIDLKGENKLRGANTWLNRTTASLSTAFGAITGSLGALQRSIAPVVEFTGELITFGDELGDTAARLNITTDALQRWRYVAERGGVDAQRFDRAIMFLNRSMAQASDGRGAASFRRLGVSIRDAGGELRPTGDVLRDTIQRLAAIENPTERTAAAMRIFGRSGLEVAQVAGQGSEAIAELSERFDELGGGFSQEAVDGASDAEDALKDLDLLLTGMKGRLAVAVLPTLSRVIETLAAWGGVLIQVVDRAGGLEHILKALAIAFAPVLVAIGTMTALTLLAIAPFVLLFLAVEDLIVMFEGGRSVIGGFIDELFGIGAAETLVHGLTEAWTNLVEILERGWALLHGEAPPDTRQQRALREGFSAQERSAARRGAITSRPGETREQAIERTNRTRRSMGLQDLGAPEQPAASARRARGDSLRPSTRVPAAGVQRAGSQITQHIRGGDVHVEVPGAGNPEETAQRVAAVLDDRRGRDLANAAAQLPQGAP